MTLSLTLTFPTRDAAVQFLASVDASLLAGTVAASGAGTDPVEPDPEPTEPAPKPRAKKKTAAKKAPKKAEPDPEPEYEDADDDDVEMSDAEFKACQKKLRSAMLKIAEDDEENGPATIKGVLKKYKAKTVSEIGRDVIVACIEEMESHV